MADQPTYVPPAGWLAGVAMIVTPSNQQDYVASNGAVPPLGTWIFTIVEVATRPSSASRGHFVGLPLHQVDAVWVDPSGYQVQRAPLMLWTDAQFQKFAGGGTHASIFGNPLLWIAAGFALWWFYGRKPS